MLTVVVAEGAESAREVEARRALEIRRLVPRSGDVVEDDSSVGERQLGAVATSGAIELGLRVVINREALQGAHQGYR